MENMIIKGTEDTPQINFNADTHELNIEGNSYALNVSEIWHEVIQWFNNFISDNKVKVTLNIKLKYFNSTTAKAILDMIDAFEEKYKEGLDIELNWFYNHEYGSIQESGQEFSEDVSFPFNIIKNNGKG